MINLAQSRAAIAAIPGDLVIVPKAQMTELFDEAERGQVAQRVLKGIRSIAAIAGAGTSATA